MRRAARSPLRARGYYRASVSITASREKFPRAITRYLPSGDQACRQMYMDVKFVSWRAGVPSIGWAQIFETPSLVRRR